MQHTKKTELNHGATIAKRAEFVERLLVSMVCSLVVKLDRSQREGNALWPLQCRKSASFLRIYNSCYVIYLTVIQAIHQTNDSFCSPSPTYVHAYHGECTSDFRGNVLRGGEETESERMWEMNGSVLQRVQLYFTTFVGYSASNNNTPHSRTSQMPLTPAKYHHHAKTQSISLSAHG